VNGSDALTARLSLGLSQDALAAETNTTPDAVAAWEVGRIKVPRFVAIDLAWRVAHHQRVAALEESGLATCAWVTAFDAEPVPTKIKAQAGHFERLLEHNKACAVCRAREAFIDERFPPMPPAPLHGWAAVVVPIAERIQRLPEWAQPAAKGAVVFVAYSLFKLIFFLPEIRRAPVSGSLTAIAGILVSGSMGAALGFLYGQYRRIRTRWSSRRSANGRCA
jgi:hypothetical protein